jgi:hypothetical protein
MEKEEDYVQTLYRAEQLGAWQEINQIAVDLGIKILIRKILYDTLRTIIGFEIRDDILEHTISRASLVDDNGIQYSLLGIHRMAGGYPFPWFLEFEPILPQSRLLTLTIEQLQSVDEQSTPLVKINTIYDPWDPSFECDTSITDKLEKWREELQAPSMPIPPTWECMGQWTYVIAPDLSAMQHHCTSHPCYIEIPFLNQVLKISRVLTGLSGTMLICDSYHQDLDRREDNWKDTFIATLARAKTPHDFAAGLKNSRLRILHPMFFNLTLFSKESQMIYPCSGSGPWGIFNTRFYYFSDTVEPANVLKLKIEEVFNITLEVPWTFALDLKDVEQNKEIPFDLTSPFINIQGRFTVREIYYDMDYILISHEIEIFTGNVNYVRMRDMKIIDCTGCEYGPLDKSSHWSEAHGNYIRGFCFPPVHFRGSNATLEIGSIDIAPLVPFEFDLVFTS